MTNAILLGAPLLVIVATLTWVLSFGNQQAAFNATHWKKFGVEV